VAPAYKAEDAKTFPRTAGIPRKDLPISTDSLKLAGNFAIPLGVGASALFSLVEARVTG
jgi:hypothetical protein